MRLDELVAARTAGIELADGDRKLWWKQTYRPGELTDAEQAVIAAGNGARSAAEAEMRELVRARLAQDAARTWEQLALFGT